MLWGRLRWYGCIGCAIDSELMSIRYLWKRYALVAYLCRRPIMFNRQDHDMHGHGTRIASAITHVPVQLMSIRVADSQFRIFFACCWYRTRLQSECWCDSCFSETSMGRAVTERCCIAAKNSGSIVVSTASKESELSSWLTRGDRCINTSWR